MYWRVVNQNRKKTICLAVLFQRQTRTQTCPDAVHSHSAQQGVQHQLSLQLHTLLSPRITACLMYCQKEQVHLINFSPLLCLESTVQRKPLPVPARIVSQTSRNSKHYLAVNETFNDKAHPYSYGTIDWVSAAVKSLSLWVSI